MKLADEILRRKNMAAWSEEEHPRAADGEFAPAGGGGGGGAEKPAGKSGWGKGTLKIHFPERSSTAAVPGNPTLSVGKDSIVIDEQNLPAKLVRLLPSGMGTVNHPDANPEAWRPFVTMAYAMGLLGKKNAPMKWAIKPSGPVRMA